MKYLASYLGSDEINAKTILVESPYVDRHWLEEYTGYYATLLSPPPAKATRLHSVTRTATENRVQDRAFQRRSDRSRPPLLALIPANPEWLEQLEVARKIRFGSTPLLG